MFTTTSAAGAAMLSMMLNGLPIQATYLQGDRDGCRLAEETANDWKKQPGVTPVQIRVAQWCTVGAVISGQWVSEQWRADAINGRTSGWRIVMPLHKQVGTAAGIHRRDLAQDPWQLDVIDPQIATRIRYRQSLQGLDAHHQESQRTTGKPLALPIASSKPEQPLRLSRHRNGEVLVSGRHPDGGSYSVLIERGIEK